MNQPLVSIVLPVYNCEKYIERCMNSIVNQAYKNIEILCINDGSTDGSLELLKKYAAMDKRIKIFSQNNSGPARARNVGIKNTSGKYLMFCDSDDWFEPTICEKMVSAIEKENTDLVYCPAHSHVEYECSNKRTNMIPYCSRILHSGKCTLDDIERRKISIMLWGKIYKMQIIKDNGVSFPNGYESDDVVFNIQYFSLAKSVYGIPDKLYNYAVRENSIMHKFYMKNKKKLYDPILIFNSYYDFLKKNKIETKNEGLFISYIFHYFRTTLNVCTEEEEKQKAIELLYSILQKTNYNYKKYAVLKCINTMDLEQLKQKLVKMCDEDFLLTKQALLKKKISKTMRLLQVLLEV